MATAIAKFPNILVHSVEEKLCPLLGFFQALGISEKQAGRLVLLNPRLISYSIGTKFSEIVGFFVSMGLDQDGMVGKILTKNPFIMGYSVEGRLRPTMEFLKVIGLSDYDLRKVAIYFSEVLCRDVERNLRPNLAFLQKCGFSDGQIAKLVAGYPPILIKSVKNCLKPRVNFLVKVMGRDISEIVDYPEFFRHGLKKSLEARQKMLKEKSIICSLREMLGCSQKKFLLKYGLC